MSAGESFETRIERGAGVLHRHVGRQRRVHDCLHHGERILEAMTQFVDVGAGCCRSPAFFGDVAHMSPFDRFPAIQTNGGNSALLAKAAVLATPLDEKTAAALNLRVDELDLSVRSANCLKYDDVVTVRDPVQKTESEMMRGLNFGRKSLNDIRPCSASCG